MNVIIDERDPKDTIKIVNKKYEYHISSFKNNYTVYRRDLKDNTLTHLISTDSLDDIKQLRLE